ncbi:hypothetical protein AgCh_017539 [Apium graveolens]
MSCCIEQLESGYAKVDLQNLLSTHSLINRLLSIFQTRKSQNLDPNPSPSSINIKLYVVMAFDKRIDVFLNFSAEDIGKNFGAHLHRSLRRADIQTITGDVSRSDTLSSVQQSRISVVVFSKNYASSAQALDELVNIRECSGTGGLVVLPVFYNFDRYSLMNQLETSKGEHELQQTGSMSRWRQALEEISSMPGYDLYKFADR